MQENQIHTILGFYDQNQEFQKNDRYSDRYQSVYTKPDDNLHWLVAIPHDNNRLEIHQTDEHGVIITRDTYESKGNTVSCLSVERLQEDSRRMVGFSADEINLIYLLEYILLIYQSMKVFLNTENFFSHLNIVITEHN